MRTGRQDRTKDILDSISYSRRGQVFADKRTFKSRHGSNTMKQITIEIPEQYEQWLCDEANRRETSVEALVWEAISAYEYRSRLPRTFSSKGVGSSGESDISQRVEEILEAEWGRAID